MPRTARRPSATGIYHIMLQAHDNQQIFYDNGDRNTCMRVLETTKQQCGFELYAYCLMGNHIHLLLRVGAEPMDKIFRRFGASFVYRYNLKYSRVGHLFRDRYRSEPIDNEAYFLTCLRYILNNPVKAGMCERMEDYRYSSAEEYLKGHGGITDTGFARELLSSNELEVFLHSENRDRCLDTKEECRSLQTDEGAAQLILQEFGSLLLQAPAVRERDDFRKSITKLYRKGISVRQFSRLTGLPKGIVERSILKEE